MTENSELSASAMAKVRLAFNVPVAGRPEAAQIVHELKEAAARYITLIEQLQASQVGAGSARECALAITHVQTASMFAVFAATAPAP